MLLEKSANPVSLADPAHFDLLTHEKIGEQPGNFRLLAFRDLQIQSRAGLAEDGDPVLFKAFFARPGIRLDEVLYRCTDDVASSTFGQPHSAAVPLPMVRTLQKKSEQYSDLSALGDFVVETEITTWTRSCKPIRPFIKESGQNVEAAQGSTNATDWEDAYTMLVALKAASHSKARPPEVATAVAELHLQLQRQKEPQTKIQTLGELLHVRISLNDFEAAARAFTSLTTGSHTVEGPQSEISQLKVPAGRFPDGAVSDIHDQLKAVWVLPLSHGIDNKTRLAKDRITRSVAADLALSSITVGPVPATRSETSQAKQQDSGHSDFPSSQSSVTTSANEAEAEDPACGRLRKYGPLTKPIAPISASRLLTDMLAHLPTDMEAHPSEYNWRATEARLAAEHSPEGVDKIDPKARRRAERLAASQRKRMVAQKQISQAVEQESAPPMVISSHFPVVREIQSNQIGLSIGIEQESDVPLPMTQPVTGTVGSRPAPSGKMQAARKKGRKQGF